MRRAVIACRTHIWTAEERSGRAAIESACVIVESQRKEKQQMPEKLYTVPQVCEMFGVSRSTMVRWMSTGKIRSFKIGQRRRIPESAIQEVIDGAA
ncbi:helix-turn-helix domain-containing protein [Gordonia amarae]